jgi:MFS family permease
MSGARHIDHPLDELRAVNTGAGTDVLAVSLMLLFSLTGVGLSLMPVIADQLQSAFQYSDSQIGLLTSVFMFALGATAIPAGLAAARWGGRVLAIGCAILMLGSVAFAFSASYGWFIVTRLVQGIGAGVTVPTCGAVIADCVSTRYRGRAWGIYGTGVGVGVMIALLVMPSVAHAGGYRAVFLLNAALAMVLGVAVLAQAPVRMSPSHGGNVMGARALAGALTAVATNRRVLLLSLFNMAALAVSVGLVVWTPQFLHTSFGASLSVSVYLTAGSGLAQLVANPLGAVAMGRWGKLAVIFVSMALMTMGTALVPFVPGLWLAFVLVTLVGFLTMSYFSPLFAAIAEVIEEPEQAGAATGLIEVFGFSGALVDTLPGKGGYLAGYLLLAAFGAIATVGVVFFTIPAAGSRA